MLTSRDLEILRAVSHYHHLHIGQIKLLLFPGNSNAQAMHNRLRLLFDHGFHVLLQTNSQTCAQNIRRFLMGVDGTDLVWVTNVNQATSATITSGVI